MTYSTLKNHGTLALLTFTVVMAAKVML